MTKKISQKVYQKNYAEGRTYTTKNEEHIESGLLQVFPYQGSRQKIVYKMKEFSAVCPFSGLPDYGVVWVKYIPQDHLVELKSLKYYYQSFRDVGIFQEAVTHRIYDDLWHLLKPQFLSIKTRYNTRGGIDTVCTIRSDQQ